MNTKINFNLQDGNALVLAVSRNLTLLTEKGFQTETQTALNAAIADLTAKEKEQNIAVKALEDFTAEQNLAVKETKALISKIYLAAKSAYETDQRNLSQFKIGQRIPDSVNGLRSLCEYLQVVVAERSVLLLKSGLVQSDITALNGAAARIVNADKGQKDAKKLQEQATLVRDSSDKALNKVKTKLRNFVKAAFQGNEEILLQFGKIPKGGGGGKGKDDTKPDDTTPPDTPTPAS
ncbi:MAG: hypothetical protein WC209_02600 [Ignavibacteriaceae bacterium]|jgi:hypothetical protein